MRWSDEIAAIDTLDSRLLDTRLVDEMQRMSITRASRTLRFSTPTFLDYDSDDVKGCSRNSFPAFSITGPACALDCDHCQAKILAPMIATTTPEMLDRRVRDLILMQDLKGFLLSGGSNRRNEIRYDRFLPVIERLKRDHPHLRIAVHTALTDATRAKAMEAAGVDTVMMDVIGAEATIREVYHLDRPVGDFEASLAALSTTEMSVVPHIVIGLHYGQLLGEAEALAICARHAIDALVLVVVMPQHARPSAFAVPSTRDVGQAFLDARMRLPATPVLLGCARPMGMHRRVTDAYAVMAGLDGIAFPAEGTVAVARAIGRPVEQQHACCSVRLADSPDILARAC